MAKNEDDGAGEEKKATIQIHMHCDTCVHEIEKCIWNAEGVHSLQIIREKCTVHVEGNKGMDPLNLIKRLQKETGKKPALISLVPKKEQKNNKRDQKPKDQRECGYEEGVLILKIDPPCDGCFGKIIKLVTKTKGEVSTVEVSSDKNSIKVKGAKKALESLKRKLPKTVNATPPPPPKKDGATAREPELQIYRPFRGSDYGYPPGFVLQLGFPHGHPTGCEYPYGYAVYGTPAAQMFSEENPNACSVM